MLATNPLVQRFHRVMTVSPGPLKGGARRALQQPSGQRSRVAYMAVFIEFYSAHDTQMSASDEHMCTFYEQCQRSSALTNGASRVPSPASPTKTRSRPRASRAS